MKLLKPSWVHHDDKPIFSVDVHQECHKFATGGQGLDSGRVVIWNLLPVLSEKAELDESVPKMLCQMDNHLACVNCVRWSQNGHMLASGSDDKLVMIWRKSKGASGVFGTGGIQKNAESWKCASTLRGHSGDVLDLAWSPHDRWLASCSIDNTIIVWDAHALPAMVAMLKGHTGLVKGVAWDPVGKFLASQSDDRSVKVWRTNDWSCSSTITEPFEECGGTTHILRLSWSPDGQYLVSAHAMNGGGPTAQIIEREGWKCDKDFVGHRKAVTCVRFHNAILKRQAANSKKPQQYCCLAVGSRDRSLSVWMTALQRPLVVIHDLFQDSILDLSWGPEKCLLMACSGDGTVVCLQFSEAELGTPLSEEDRNSLYQRIYGKSAATLENGSGGGAADLLIENAELLLNASSANHHQPPALPTASAGPIIVTNHNNTLLKPPSQMAGTANGFANGGAVADNAVGMPTAAQAIAKQLETRTVDGKRRITPMFIPLNQETNEIADAATAACSSSPLLSSSSRPMQMDLAQDVQRPTDAMLTLMTAAIVAAPAATVGGSNANITEAEQTRLDTRLIKNVTPSATNAGMPAVQPSTANPCVVTTFPLNGSTSSTAAGGGGDSMPFIGATPTAYQASTTGPKITITATTKCEFQKTALERRVHVHNGCVRTAVALLCKVTAYTLAAAGTTAAGGQQQQQLWQLFVGSPVVNLNFCRSCVLLCSLDGSMRLLDMRTGLPLLPVLMLSGPVLQCAFCPLGRLVGVITDCGLLRIWNIAEQRVTVAATCTDICGRCGPVQQFSISDRGVALALFANGNSYAYSPQMSAWLVLNTRDPLVRHGLHATVPKNFPRDLRSFPLTSVQAATHSFAGPTGGGAIEMNTDDWQSAAKISFIENQIKLCESIDSPHELQHWYTMLAYHLAVSGGEKRLRQLMDDLLGAEATALEGNSPSPASTMILSIPKHTLLAAVLNVLRSHVKWQRIYMEYNELFETAKSELHPIATATATSTPPAAAERKPNVGILNAAMNLNDVTNAAVAATAIVNTNNSNITANVNDAMDIV